MPPMIRTAILLAGLLLAIDPTWAGPDRHEAGSGPGTPRRAFLRGPDRHEPGQATLPPRMAAPSGRGLAHPMAATDQSPAADRPLAVWREPLPVEVQPTLAALLADEDTNGDRRITVDDPPGNEGRGNRSFTLRGTDGRTAEVRGTTRLAALVQELFLAADAGEQETLLSFERVAENPVQRLSRQISEYFWDGLTRRIDREHLAAILQDSKTEGEEGKRYLYVPASDDEGWSYFSALVPEFRHLHLEVVRLPATITPEFVRGLDGRHGLLALGLQRGRNHLPEGIPFVVPGGRFNEMYGWDSYFEALGLLQDGRVELAKGMVDQFVYQIRQYGKILNANRTYYLTRSQPPFLVPMMMAVREHLPAGPHRRAWLAGVTAAAVQEYEQVWCGPERLTPTGLSRYHGEGIGVPPEVEPGHFDADFARFARAAGRPAAAFEADYRAGRLAAPAIDLFFTHDRSLRESGHDKTWRWHDRCSDFVTVDLNSLLYRAETDLARLLTEEFGGRLNLPDGRVTTAREWSSRAERRREAMNLYLWDEVRGLFLDYDFVRQEREFYPTPVLFYPLWAGLATPDQARSIVTAALPLLRQPGGLAASTEEARGPVTPARPQRQWDFPNGWAPHQMMAWDGLGRAGFEAERQELIYRWLYMIARNAADHHGTVPEKFDVVTRSHRVFAEYGNVGTEFAYITREGFGWMNASFQVGLAALSSDLRSRLERLVPPEFLFRPGR
ncbi:MAG: trehalase [Candidatus Riflebacteria bacterium]|nr:trehalase [Candidatus Riflebacteria bacterium]